MRIIDNMHVLLLKGGYGSEREVSLKSAEACSKAIKENGLKVNEIDISETNLNDLINIKANVCVNALHGNYGENGTLKGTQKLLKMTYTHS